MPDIQMTQFMVSMLLVLAMALFVLLYEVLERCKLRRRLSRSTAVELLCRGDNFDFDKLLKVYHLSPMTHDVQKGEYYYAATLGGKKRIRLTLRLVNNHYVLEKIERYRDVNWQFTDWYDDYEHRNDRAPLSYIATGACNSEEADEKHRLPGFVLTHNAIEKLVEECAA